MSTKRTAEQEPEGEPPVKVQTNTISMIKKDLCISPCIVTKTGFLEEQGITEDDLKSQGIWVTRKTTILDGEKSIMENPTWCAHLDCGYGLISFKEEELGPAIEATGYIDVDHLGCTWLHNRFEVEILLLTDQPKDVYYVWIYNKEDPSDIEHHILTKGFKTPEEAREYMDSLGTSEIYGFYCGQEGDSAYILEAFNSEAERILGPVYAFSKDTAENFLEESMTAVLMQEIERPPMYKYEYVTEGALKKLLAEQ